MSFLFLLYFSKWCHCSLWYHAYRFCILQTPGLWLMTGHQLGCRSSVNMLVDMDGIGINPIEKQQYYNDVIISAIASQITSLTIVYSTVYSDANQGKHKSSASLAFLRGIHRGPVNSLHKWPVTRKMFPFDDVTMNPSIEEGWWITCAISVLKNANISQVYYHQNSSWH